MPSYAENLKFQADKAREPITTTITERQQLSPQLLMALLSQVLAMFAPDSTAGEAATRSLGEAEKGFSLAGESVGGGTPSITDKLTMNMPPSPGGGTASLGGLNMQDLMKLLQELAKSGSLAGIGGVPGKPGSIF